MGVTVGLRLNATAGMVFYESLSLGEEVGCSRAELETIAGYFPICTLPQGEGEGLAKHPLRYLSSAR